jgi:hypothetical protein
MASYLIFSGKEPLDRRTAYADEFEACLFVSVLTADRLVPVGRCLDQHILCSALSAGIYRQLTPEGAEPDRDP